MLLGAISAERVKAGQARSQGFNAPGDSYDFLAITEPSSSIVCPERPTDRVMIFAGNYFAEVGVLGWSIQLMLRRFLLALHHTMDF